MLKNGQITDVFGPGHYTLTTDNIPVLQKLINIPFGGKSPFSAEVWFINKAFALDIKWGTTTPIQVQDPKYGVFVPLRAFGQFGIQIEDSRKFLIKLVGTMPFFNTKTLTEYFKGLYITRVKDRLSTCLVASKISILEINSHLDEISSALSKQLQEEFAEFGIKVHSFYVNDVNVPENDPAVKQLKAALAKRAEMGIKTHSVCFFAYCCEISQFLLLYNKTYVIIKSKLFEFNSNAERIVFMAVTYKRLWHLLIDRNMKKKDLQELANLTPHAMRKLGNNETVTTDTLAKICRSLECSVEDIMEVLPEDI